MIRRVNLVLLLMLLLGTLAGCGGGTASQTTAEIDVSKLADTIDVATVKALQGRSDVVFFDVREQVEYDAGHIPNITLIPMNQVPDRLAEIPKDKTVILTCRTGNRSGQVADFLRQQGYTNVHNMAGGIVAWQQAGYPVEK